MHTLLFILVGYGSLGLITSTIPISTIDLDASEISQLARDLKRFSPAVARQLMESTCQMFSQCCSHNQSTFLSMTLFNDTEGCVGETGSSSFLAKILSCPPLVKFTTLITNPQSIKYMSIIAKKSDPDKEEMNILREVCSEKEIYAVICDWDHFDQYDSCQRKLIQKLANQGDQKVYKFERQQMKDLYIELNAELKKEFNN